MEKLQFQEETTKIKYTQDLQMLTTMKRNQRQLMLKAGNGKVQVEPQDQFRKMEVNY